MVVKLPAFRIITVKIVECEQKCGSKTSIFAEFFLFLVESSYSANEKTLFQIIN